MVLYLEIDEMEDDEHDDFNIIHLFLFHYELILLRFELDEVVQHEQFEGID